MSRVIKFRAFSRSRMTLITQSNGHWVWFDNDGIMQTIQDGMELMQFTGLLDKNGAEIFEGDVVEANCGVVTIDNKPLKGTSIESAVVYWQDRGGWGMRTVGGNARNKHRIGNTGSLIYKDIPKYWEIIGNIHEQPELLK